MKTSTELGSPPLKGPVIICNKGGCSLSSPSCAPPPPIPEPIFKVLPWASQVLLSKSGQLRQKTSRPFFSLPYFFPSSFPTAMFFFFFPPVCVWTELLCYWVVSHIAKPFYDKWGCHGDDIPLSPPLRWGQERGGKKKTKTHSPVPPHWSTEELLWYPLRSPEWLLWMSSLLAPFRALRKRGGDEEEEGIPAPDHFSVCSCESETVALQLGCVLFYFYGKVSFPPLCSRRLSEALSGFALCILDGAGRGKCSDCAGVERWRLAALQTLLCIHPPVWWALTFPSLFFFFFLLWTLWLLSRPTRQG